MELQIRGAYRTSGSYGATAFRQLIVTVTPAPQPAVTLTPATASVTAGDSTTFTASGGTGSGAYTWGGTAGATGMGTSQTLTFPTAGTFTVTAFRAGDATYAASTTTSVNGTVNPASDTIAPSAPPNLQASNLTSSGFTLSWGAASDNVGIAGYEVSLNGGAPVAAVGLSRAFTGLASASSFTLQVRALDAAGNASAWAEASATTGGGGTPGTGTAQSIWLDVTGDGIRDELVQAGTAEFSYNINTWVMVNVVYSGSPINSFWQGQNLSFQDQNFTSFSYIWQPPVNFWVSFQTFMILDFTIEAEANRKMRIYRDGSGSAVLNLANWQLFQTLEFPTSGPQTILTSSVNPDWLNGSKFFLVKEGAPIGSLRIRDSFGEMLLDSLLANPAPGTVPTVTLPAGTTNLLFSAKDLLGNLLNVLQHGVVFSVKNTLGQIVPLANNGLLVWTSSTSGSIWTGSGRSAFGSALKPTARRCGSRSMCSGPPLRSSPLTLGKSTGASIRPTQPKTTPLVITGPASSVVRPTPS